MQENPRKWFMLYGAGASEASKAEVTPFGDAGQVKYFNKQEFCTVMER
jgi:hypothetical protein